VATLASEIIDRVQEKLNDLGNIRWTLPEVIRSINDGQKMILEADPTLFETTASVAVQQGSRQTVPTDCYMLLDVIQQDISGVFVATPRKITKGIMDRQVPGWIGAAIELKVYHWIQNETELDYFYIHPPLTPANQTLRIRYAKYPTAVTAGTSTLSIPDELINALYYFCMMRALEKDEKFAGSAQAARYGQMFAGMFRARKEGDMAAFQQRVVDEEST
jgi:hypothetical protein